MLPVDVDGGGPYDKAQFLPSLSVAFLELVTVMGMQLNLIAWLGSEKSVSVVVTVITVVTTVVSACIAVTGGQSVQILSEPQD
jgi:hypothetical protein